MIARDKPKHVYKKGDLVVVDEANNKWNEDWCSGSALRGPFMVLDVTHCDDATTPDDAQQLTIYITPTANIRTFSSTHFRPFRGEKEARVDKSNTGMIDGLPLSDLEVAVFYWWKTKRPGHWTGRTHFSDAHVNTASAEERRLVDAFLSAVFELNEKINGDSEREYIVGYRE